MKTRVFFAIAIGVVALVVFWALRPPPLPSPAPAISTVTKKATPIGAAAAPTPPAIEAPSIGPARENPPTVSPPAVSREEKVSQLVHDIEITLNSVDDPDREGELAKLISGLIQLDPAAAGYLAEKWEPGSVREELLRRVTQAWTAADPAGAIAWLAKLPDDGDRKSASAYACFQIAESDPPAAMEAAALLGLGDYKGTMEDLAQRWAQENLSAALDWSRARPPGEARDRLLARLALVQADTAPADAARLVAGEIAPGAVQDEATLAVLHAWAIKDTAAATAWVERFPEGPLRDRARSELADAMQNAATKGAAN